MRQTILAAKHDRASLRQRKLLESVGQILAKTWLRARWRGFGRKLGLIDSNQILATPGIFPKAVIGNSVEPGRKPRFSPKAPQIAICLKKSFLRQIVRERKIGADQLAEQTSDTRLMIADQLRKSVVIIIEENSGDEVCIG